MSLGGSVTFFIFSQVYSIPFVQGLWELFQRQLSVPLNVRDMLPERAIPDLPAPAHGLEEVLSTAVPGARL